MTIPSPLGISLVSATAWSAAGSGEWEGQPASLWETNVSLGEGGDYDVAIYLDPATAIPRGERWRAEESGETVYAVSYDVQFRDPSDVPADAFDIDGMRSNLLSTIEGYEAVWMGTETGPVGGLPSLSLKDSRVSDRPGEEFVEFEYQVIGRIPLPLDQRFGLMEITVRPIASWERYVEDRHQTWLEGAVRERVMVMGEEAEFAVESFNETHAALWLGDVVVKFETQAFTDSPPAENYEGGVAPTPVYDRNAFNSADAVRALLPLLRPVQ